tara:strand:+ start:7876 stop:8427 length:552 start_codon:yes stop_codon:yes gene_type:complete
MSVMAIPGLISMGMSLFGPSGPSRSEMEADLQPFKDGLDGQMDRINEYRDPNSNFWAQNRDSLLNQVYNSSDFSNMLNNRMMFGASSGIMNQQNLDRTTKAVQGTGQTLQDAWLNLQGKSDDMYSNWLQGQNQYSQALTGITSAQYQQEMDKHKTWQSGLNQMITPYNEAGSTLWGDVVNKFG